ncbi:MAG: glycerol dehydrogenase [Bacillales bacterium]|jgi:uncharacterized oxidoreductase|nr:glycerol dehydrogenase [Bacillales bacterium]
MENINVHGAPSEYILREGILCQLENKLLVRGLKKVLIIHGEKSWKAAKPHWPSFSQIVYKDHTHTGECSQTHINNLAQLVQDNSFDAVIGVGGGKILDLVKAIGTITRRPSILVPTLASNCSAWTPISVIYDDSGSFIRYDIYPISTSLVLIEPQILLEAPINMLIAGIGDTLAKWYEADVQMEIINNKSVPLIISHYTARLCRDILLQHSELALLAVRNKKLNDDFIKIVETIIMLGGMVGGFGDKYGRIAGAHSIHNGLTVLDQTHNALHGEKVAYGILVQLALEDKWDDINLLLSFYEKLGLPSSLKELGVKIIDDKTIESIAVKATDKNESIHVMPLGEITVERVKKAIYNVEKLVL